MIHYYRASAKNCIQSIKMQRQLTSKPLPVLHALKHNTVLCMLMCFVLSASVISAQDTFLGLTSNGGPEGRGTAFSIRSTGANFAVTKGFADWGKTPNGDLIQGSDGDFYGMTYTGGTYTYGSIFKMTLAGVITILHQFNYAADGANPYGELTKGTDGNFYGMTSSGGTNSYGTIFKITPGGVFTVLKQLVSADGTNPRGHLVLAPDGNFYGASYAGGAFGSGTIFKVTAAGALTVLHSLSSATDGANCYGSLVRGTDGLFYGTTNGGGSSGMGTIFKITSAGAYTVLHTMLTADGVHSQSDLIQATDGDFYGVAYGGGASGGGTVFKITAAGSFTVLKNLSAATDGQAPYGGLVQGIDGLLYGMNSGGGAHSNGTVFKMTTTGTLTPLRSLTTVTDGGSPRGNLIQATDGNFYGMTSTGGNSAFGTAFKISATGTFTLLNGFNGSVGGNTPFESLIQSIKDNAYYGTTNSGGVYNYGTVFKLCGGVHTVIHSFNNTVDGGSPQGSLVQGTDSNFYGMTYSGGTNGSGTIFKITATGTYTVLKNLLSSTDGGLPKGSLVLGTDGIFYGMTNTGGTNGGGTIFKITSAGAFNVLRSLLSSTDGANPEGNLIQGADGNFYGMTSSPARVFKITPAGVFTPLHTFSGNDGGLPLGSLLLAADGNFYGTASNGGLNAGGTIFKMTTAGIYTVLRPLTSAADGSAPKGNLLQGTDGNLYGMTSAGGTYAAGTLFKITTGGTYTVLRHFNLLADGGIAFGSLIRTVNNLIADPQTITTTEDVSKKITLTGSGGSPLVFTVTTKPKHGSVSGNGSAKTYKPKANYEGKDSFAFTVSVGCLSSPPAIIKITITAVPDTPKLAPIGDKSVVKNTTLTFTAKATDPDKGESLTFSLIGAPAGASIGTTSGIFTWMPTTSGSFIFKVRVTDNSALALYDEEQITVTVTNATPQNNAVSSQIVAGKFIDATLSPNPVVNKLVVILNVPVDEVSATITDLKGVVPIKPQFTISGIQKFEIDASTLKPGIYFLRLETKDGNKTYRFIKQ